MQGLRKRKSRGRPRDSPPVGELSERQIREGTGVGRDAIRLIRHGKGVKRSTYEKVINFLRENASPASPGLCSLMQKTR